MSLPDPEFPPLLTGHPVRAPECPFESALAGVMQGKYGAADFLWARDTARLDCAVVLEPTVDRRRAAEMAFVAMVAFGDSFGAMAPPEVGLTYRWPFTLCVNGARVGHVRAAISAREDAAGHPDWMVVGLSVNLRRDRRDSEPGSTPDMTDLLEEGCGDLTRTALHESYARHLLTWIHAWDTEGFQGVHELLLFRYEGYREEVAVDIGGVVHDGRFVGLDDHGAMILETGEGTRLLDALEVIEAPIAASEGA